MLFGQEQLAHLRRNTNRAPHLQTTSKQNHGVERMWVEINGRVNYPLKACLVTLQERGEIDMDCPHQKFCTSWFTIQISNIGTTLAVQAWNEHPIPGIYCRPSYPGFTPVASQGRRGASAAAGYSLKVVQAHVSCFAGGRPQFQKLGQTFIVLGEATANIHHVSSAPMIKTEFGDDHVLVTADGLEVRDSSGTQGLKFWKVNTRKFYAIPHEDLLAPIRKKARRQSETTIDLTDGTPCNCEDALEDVRCELTGVQAKLGTIFELTKHSKVPLGLQQLLDEAYKCKICRGMISPPLIVTKCCKSILGCDACVKEWYATDPLGKNCPAFNMERGYVETMRLHGLDELLTGLKDLEDV